MKGKISNAFLATAVAMIALSVSAKVDDIGIVDPFDPFDPIDPIDSSLVKIDKGYFSMGSPINESGRYSDEDQVSVEISKDF